MTNFKEVFRNFLGLTMKQTKHQASLSKKVYFLFPSLTPYFSLSHWLVIDYSFVSPLFIRHIVIHSFFLPPYPLHYNNLDKCCSKHAISAEGSKGYRPLDVLCYFQYFTEAHAICERKTASLRVGFVDKEKNTKVNAIIYSISGVTG